jgi:PAS domain S-box-containing protein
MTPAKALPAKSVARQAGALAVFVGGMVLVGWAFDIAALKSILPGWVAVKPNTALAFVLIGLALLLQLTPQVSTLEPQLFRLRLARFCAVLAGLIGLLTLSEYAFGWNLGIDQWLFREPAGAVGTSHPGRMAPDTALCFVLLASLLWATGSVRKSRWALTAGLIVGLLVTTVGLVGILTYLIPGIGLYGWWGLTMMGAPAAAVFAVLGAAIVLGSWREVLGSRLTQFSSHLWRMVGCVGALAIAFALYARSEQQLTRANELRYRSFLLADELRQSGDDLTRMARTYVVTGERVYKQHFQDILDIRNGKKPRPQNYALPYWDLVLVDGPAPRAGQQTIPLLELMRQAGFTEGEFRKLAEAKANSDGLTIPEFEAMKLVESTGPEAEANRARARMMMYDARYHQAKAAVMGPIYDFFVLVDKRTLAAVDAAENSATIFRTMFAAIGLGLMFVLWRTYVVLCDTLGGSVDEVYEHISRIGSGDFSAAIPVKAGLENSVLGWLSETQVHLNEIDHKRKQADEALRESESRFRQIAESLPQLVWTCRPDGPCDYLNRQWIEFTGVPEAQQFGFGWLEQLHPDDRASTVAAWEAAVASGADFRVEFRIRRHDGEYRYFDTQAVRLRDAEGRTMKWFGSNTDITERKQAEAVQSRLAAIVDSSADAIISETLTGVVMSWNAAAERLFGYSTEEMIGQTIMRLIPPDRLEEEHRLLSQIGRDERVESYDTVRVHKDGRHVDVSLVISPIKNAEGRVVGASKIVRDISERKRAEAEIRHLNAELEQRVQDRTAELEAANKELEAFSYSVSHDLRAPLRAIDGYGRILMEDHAEWLDGEGRRVLGVISSETQRMGQLIDDLLAFSRLGRQKLESSEINMTALAQSERQGASLTRQLLAFSRKQVLEPKVFDLGVVVSSMENLLQRLIGEDIDLRILTRPDGGMVEADANQMEQVVMNLAINSRDAMPQGGRLTIEISNKELDEEYARLHLDAKPGPYVTLSVTDTGCGMDPETLSHVFEPFFTTKGMEKGTGLGLAMVYGIVTQSRGSISVYSEPDHGTTFKIYLPRVGDSGEEVASEQSNGAPTGGPETILLVDDNESIRSAVGELMKMKGYNVLVAGAGKEALEISRNHEGPIDLLITDVVMPEMSGRELAQQVSAERAEIKVLYMSGYTDDAVLRYGILSSDSAFLQKPAPMATLLRKIRDLLD